MEHQCFQHQYYKHLNRKGGRSITIKKIQQKPNLYFLIKLSAQYVSRQKFHKIYISCFLRYLAMINNISQLKHMNSYCQLRKQTANKQHNFEFHPTTRNQTPCPRAFQPPSQKNWQSKVSLKQNTIYETLDSQLSHDILKEINAKNKILSAQLEQYKLLVVNMQKKIGELKQQNYELNQKILVLGKSTDINLEIQEDQSQLFTQTLPMHRILNQNSSKDSMFSCQQIKKIFGVLQQHSSQVTSRKAELKNQLMKIVQQKRELQNFVQNLWELKDRIEPGAQQFLYQLWKWLKVIAINYFQLKEYKKEIKDQRLGKMDKY